MNMEDFISTQNGRVFLSNIAGINKKLETIAQALLRIAEATEETAGFVKDLEEEEEDD